MMNPRPEISVLVATRERNRGLSRLLGELSQQTFDPARFEVLVIDNSAGGGAREVVESGGFRPPLRLRYFHEPAPGKSRAMNRGLAAAGAEILAATDDDCLPDPGWLEGIRAAFAREWAGVFCLTGRVIAEAGWGDYAAVGLERAGRTVYRGFFGRLQAGRIGNGSNVAYRRQAFAELGGFSPDLGPGSPLGSGEETEFFDRVLAAGKTIVFLPGISVRHRPERGPAENRRREVEDLRARGAVYACRLRRGDPVAGLLFFLRVLAGVPAAVFFGFRQVLRPQRPAQFWARPDCLAALITGFVRCLCDQDWSGADYSGPRIPAGGGEPMSRMEENRPPGEGGQEMMKKDWDAIVIGAGPAGSTAAYHLARGGWATLLLEKESVPGRRKACGGLALSDLRSALSLPAAVCEKDLSRAVFALRGEEKGWSSPYPSCLSFRRREFDAFLARRAAVAGARLLCSARVLRSGVGEVVVEGEGGESVYRGRIVIYADGIPTRAWKDRGIGFSPADPFSPALVYEVAAPGNAAAAVGYCLEPDILPFGCFWIFPKRDLLNVGAARLRGTGGPGLKNALDDFCRRHPLTSGREIVSRRAGLIPNRRAARIHGEGCLVAGDAGGLVDPVTGAGIHNALASGSLAGRAAAWALENDRLSAAALARYPRLWRGSREGRWIAFWGLVFRGLPFLNARISPEVFARTLRSNILFSLRTHRWIQSRFPAAPRGPAGLSSPGGIPDPADLFPADPGDDPGQAEEREYQVERVGGP